MAKEAAVQITHPERVISDDGQVTKGELAEYYLAVSRLMLPSIARRPISLLRCPQGVDKQCFYQRNPGRGLGKEVHPFPFRHNGKDYEYLYIETEAGLMELVQMGAIEIHPWGAKIDAIDLPDSLTFDLDPAPGVPFAAVKLAALDVRARLKALGMASNLRCTGGKGLHIWVPLQTGISWPDLKEFAGSIAHQMVKDLPDVYVATTTKAKRTGRIFVDYFRNDYTATAIADYSVRARPGAPVAMPLEWKELDAVESGDQFRIPDVLKRIRGKRKILSVPLQAIPSTNSSS